jgi:predicted component of type VI protein secretion system
MARLLLADGSSVEVEDGLVLGRVSGCDIVLEDDKVSRKHARLIVQVGVVEVEDLGSRNGVHINGARVLRRVLRDGDVLLIGRTEMRFVEAVATTKSTTPDLAGVDLLADEEVAPARATSAGAAPASADQDELELDFGGDDVVSAAVPEVRAEPVPRPAPARVPEPPPAEDVEVLEFVDEVVEVRKPVRPAAAAAPGATSQGAARALPDRDSGVLQFHKNVQARGGLGEDVGQLGGLRKLIVVLLGVVAAAAAAYGAYVFAG